ncbi:MAG: DUF302 domain-containing protein [marine benthic group bacterium]|jgi:uncharacterized protein (DUF302 family)|nr:DUF302 domain-containing protein [Gemmatimonadota bacterium]MCL7964637.1 DUF302 domain-containing protein [Gemmatimonadota bacterium]MCL7966795.1 DUF302 domain-containing protein [Gemmatimonadota bacterium]MCL7970406.1 DUF302 domain-containing protein [Gemmatimonadota bacterium]MCL7976733.1 DUF302 domain-containing protein [Gemmatimonadota bacterium]
MRENDFGMYRALPGVSYDEAVQRVEAALQDEGFGILTRIDVRETLKKKIDVDFHPYVILGACNPPLAHRALSAEDTIGLMLPCNVVVAESPDGSEVSIARPTVMMQVADAEGLESVANEAQERLERALARV